MPIAILTATKSYQNREMFPKEREWKVLLGERVQVTEDQAEHLFATGLFEVIEDAAPAPRRCLEKHSKLPQNLEPIPQSETGVDL